MANGISPLIILAFISAVAFAIPLMYIFTSVIPWEGHAILAAPIFFLAVAGLAAFKLREILS